VSVSGEGRRVASPGAAFTGSRDQLLDDVQVITIGVQDFAIALWNQDVPCVHVDWAPPRPEDIEMRDLLDRLL
jgi:hypothetical protein